MNRYLVLIVLSLAVFSVFSDFVGAEVGERQLYEMPRTQVIPIQDSQFDRQYELYIKLPEGYDENSKKEYPVIYFTDAVWHIDMLSACTEYLMKDVVLVGISWQKDINGDLMKERGAHVSRFRDYSIRKSSNLERQAKYQFGQANHHLNFIRNDVIKYVENSYRIDPNNRTYFGYSMGGKFGAYILLTQPETFKNYIFGSPSLKGEFSIISELTSNTVPKRKPFNANVFVSYGSEEKVLGEYVDKFIGILRAKNDKNLYLMHVVVEGDHQAAFPMTGVRSISWLSGLTMDKE
ncbi:alpha/beta hydrolase [Teredinibacter franksiae]|uniref:alpha/beta hydrolase n=1 Tax=Teredinibacter franksiae TaxID=2761453 RepID=UPI00162454AE|nr:alpha/beta hydrolase-fold protein [Teredinibacter franksiae]